MAHLPKRPPLPARPNLLGVYDGRTAIGHLLLRGKTGVVGLFATAELAVDAVAAAYGRSEVAA